MSTSQAKKKLYDTRALMETAVQVMRQRMRSFEMIAYNCHQSISGHDYGRNDRMNGLKTTSFAYPDNYLDTVSGYKRTAGRFRQGRIPNRTANQSDLARFAVASRTNDAIGPIRPDSGAESHPYNHAHGDALGIPSKLGDAPALKPKEIRLSGGIENGFVFLTHLRYQFCLLSENTRQKERTRLISLFACAIRERRIERGKPISAAELFALRT